MNPLTGQSGVFEPDDGNPLAKPPTLADGWQYNAAAYGNWLAGEKASGIASGMIDPDTGWPTANALVDAAHQYGSALIGSTSAPGGAARVLYHGMPGAMEGTTLRPSNYGHFGPGVYLTEQPTVARSYGENVLPATVDGQLFQAWDRSGAPGTLRQDPASHDAILNNLSADDRAKVEGLKNWYKNDSADFYQALSRSVSPAKAQAAIAGAGYHGIEGIGDGHEIVVFSPSNVKMLNQSPPTQ